MCPKLTAECGLFGIQSLAEAHVGALNQLSAQTDLIESLQNQLADCGADVERPLRRTWTTSATAAHDYALTAIGDQCWFAENLRATDYNNGDAIPTRPTGPPPRWRASRDGRRNQRLHLWPPLQLACRPEDSRGLCPSGWHVPDDTEWQALIDAIGAQGALQLKATSGWTAGPNGTDDHGFDGRPAGRRGSMDSTLTSAPSPPGGAPPQTTTAATTSTASLTIPTKSTPNKASAANRTAPSAASRTEPHHDSQFLPPDRRRPPVGAGLRPPPPPRRSPTRSSSPSRSSSLASTPAAPAKSAPTTWTTATSTSSTPPTTPTRSCGSKTKGAQYGAPRFIDTELQQPNALAIGDLNGDSIPDLVVASENQNAARTYLGGGEIDTTTITFPVITDIARTHYNTALLTEDGDVRVFGRSAHNAWPCPHSPAL